MSVEGKLIDRNLFFESAQSAKWRVLRVTKRRKVSRFAVFFPPSDFVRGHERRKKREWTRNLRNTNNLCCCCVCIMDFCPFSWRFLTYSLSLSFSLSLSLDWRTPRRSKWKVKEKKFMSVWSPEKSLVSPMTRGIKIDSGSCCCCGGCSSCLNSCAKNKLFMTMKSGKMPQLTGKLHFHFQLRHA